MKNHIFDLELFIKNKINNIMSEEKDNPPDLTEDFLYTDNFAEVLEKLIILHIRTWMLEDMASSCQDDTELGSIKRKLDICFKQKRPSYIQAINRMIDDSICNNKRLIEDSVKVYKDNLK